jgi:hypothetical protein
MRALLTVFLLFFCMTPSFAQDDPESETPAIEEPAEPATEDDAAAPDEEGEAEKEDEVKEPAEPEAPAESEPGAELPPEIFDTLLNAVQSKNWSLAAACVLMILVWGLRKSKALAKVDSKALPWISVAMGVAWSASSAALDGEQWGAAILQGILVGLAGSGLWDTLGKQALGKPEEEPDPSEE